MHYNSIIASLTIALVALASLAAMIWQVVQGHDTDAQLAGILGLSLGAFLRMPGTADPVQIQQPADKPVPVNEVDG
jgi:hypothetical protein